MKRLIYAPKVWVYIKGRDNNLYDISDYVVSGSVERRLNEVSSATVTFRNPDRVFTQLGNPAFLPMDPITIFLQRHIDTPVRVFTGYIDEAPYYQMKPGVATIKASCTLKKLQFTFWDPALPFVNDLLTKLGWEVDLSNGVLINPGNLAITSKSDLTKTGITDGSLGKLLYTILNLVGGWSDNTIWIENLPPDLLTWTVGLFTKYFDEGTQERAQLEHLFGQLIGTATLGGSGSLTGTAGTGTGTSGTGTGVGANVPATGALQVAASQECSDLGHNSGGGCGSHNNPAALENGWSELMNCGSLGGLPCDTELYLSANGKTVKAPKVDCGGGSSFNPVIGIYPQTSKDLGLFQGTCLTGSYTVTIWRADGKPLTLHSGSGHAVSGHATPSSTPTTTTTTHASNKPVAHPASAGSSGSTIVNNTAPTLNAPRRRIGPLKVGGGAIAAPSARNMLLPSSNYRSRPGPVKLIVLHATEGGSFQSIFDYWLSKGLSAHIVDDQGGNSVRYVDDSNVAFHVASFNDISVGLEQIGFTSQASWPDAQMRTSAQWVAYWAVKFNIPLVRSTSHGVTTHNDLGAAGGGHTDPGAGYPFDRVLGMAKQFAAGHSVASGAGGHVYVLGDSILADATTTCMASALKNAGWTSTIDGLQSRALPAGISILQGKPGGLTSANAVVIELGTNDSGSAQAFASQVSQAVAAIAAAAPSATIYWVNLFSNVPQKAAYNQVLAAQKNITVIDSTGAGIPLSPDGIHPSDSTKFCSLIAGAIGSGAGTGSAGSAGAGTGVGGISADQVFQIAKGVAFGTELQWPDIAARTEAISLRGHKSLMNDKPLLSFVQQISGACMRSFQSAPNGDFFAFFPDHFGEFKHRSPYWNIHDIEILTGDIQLTDASLVTHMYVVGDTLMANYGGGNATAGLLEKIISAGTTDIYDFFKSGLDNTKGAGSKTGGPLDSTVAPTPTNNNRSGSWSWGGRRNWSWPSAPTTTATAGTVGPMSLHSPEGINAFLARYGARPFENDQPLIRSNFFEAFYSIQQFMLAWSQQFATNFTFTFMPELFPGGRVNFNSHGINMYIESVTHSFDYENGFTTEAELTSPSAANETTFTGNTQSPAWGMVNSITP